MKLSVNSEVGELRAVLLHRPSHEIENLTPELLERLLFDDIPYLKIAQEEHDFFAKTLRDEGVEVFYLDDLITESIKREDVKDSFIREFLVESGLKYKTYQDLVINYLLSLPSRKTLVQKLMGGILKSEVEFSGYSLSDMVHKDYPFISDPLPNLYFTRDTFATIGCGVSLNHMHTKTRQRETLFSKYIFKYHPMFSQEDIPFWYQRENATSIEGGDILIVNETTLCVGISQRTQPESVEMLANRLFNSEYSKINTIYAFHIPAKRTFMHLDTVFTQIDRSTFTIHGKIEGPLCVYRITKGKSGLAVEKLVDKIDKILQKFCKDKVKLIRCGGGEKIIAGREQWNDGSNTLAIRPKEVVVYERNYVTNKMLQDNGIKLHTIRGSELSRGRGGPRCMSMPLIRNKISA